MFVLWVVTLSRVVSTFPIAYCCCRSMCLLLAACSRHHGTVMATELAAARTPHAYRTVRTRNYHLHWINYLWNGCWSHHWICECVCECACCTTSGTCWLCRAYRINIIKFSRIIRSNIYHIYNMPHIYWHIFAPLLCTDYTQFECTATWW